MATAPQFDAIITNDDLEKAKNEIYQLVNKFLIK
jgi:guanylate kinase